MPTLSTLGLEAAMRPIKADGRRFYDVRSLPEPCLGVLAHAGGGVENQSGSRHMDGVGRAQHGAAWLCVELGVSGLHIFLGKSIARLSVQLDAIRRESDALSSIHHARRTRKRNGFLGGGIP